MFGQTVNPISTRGASATLCSSFKQVQNTPLQSCLIFYCTIILWCDRKRRCPAQATSNFPIEFNESFLAHRSSFRMIGIYSFKKCIKHNFLTWYKKQLKIHGALIVVGIYLFRGNFNPTRELGLSMVLIDMSILWPNFTV